jgi:hypothetical protein
MTNLIDSPNKCGQNAFIDIVLELKSTNRGNQKIGFRS